MLKFHFISFGLSILLESYKETKLKCWECTRIYLLVFTANYHITRIRKVRLSKNLARTHHKDLSQLGADTDGS